MKETNKKNENFFSEKIMPKVTDGIVNGIIDTIGEFTNNFEKRRNVGFGFFQSIGGSFEETVDYWLDGFLGIEHHPSKQAIYFTNKDKK